MKPPERKRRILRWTGVVLSLLIVATWVATLVWVFHYEAEFKRYGASGTAVRYRSFRFSISDGDVYFQYQPLRLYQSYEECGIHPRYQKWEGRIPARDLLPRFEHYPNNAGWAIDLPLWTLLVIVAVPTRAFWRPHQDQVPRKRSMLARLGTALVLVMGAVWVVSLAWSLRYDRIGPKVPLTLPVGLRPRVVFVGGGPVFSAYLRAGCLYIERSGSWSQAAPEWVVDRGLRRPQWQPRLHGNIGVRFYYVLPLWVPFLLVAIPTGFLWWRSRRRIPPNCCQQCGYDLTGNVSGVCPECGSDAGKTSPTGS